MLIWNLFRSCATDSCVIYKLAMDFADSPDMNTIENLSHEIKHFLRKTFKPRNIRKNLYQVFDVSVIPSHWRNVSDTSASQESDSGGYFIPFHHSRQFCNIHITSELTNKSLEVVHRNVSCWFCLAHLLTIVESGNVLASESHSVFNLWSWLQ